MTELPSAVDVPGHVLERVIGRGGTCVVWAGTDPDGRAVAVKVPRAGQDLVDRMQSDAERQVLTALRHDHLVTLRAVVPLPDGRLATVFDLVDGATLRTTVDSRGHLRPGETVTVLTPLCDAVATLHRAGATHGDISPGNVLVTAGGRPLLADLGAARVAGSGGAVLGTPGFVAPEVLAGSAPTAAADVYGLGALAWYCLTGRGAPETPIRLGLDVVVRHVGPELAEVVAACIDPEPSRRPTADRLGPLVYAAARAQPIEVVVGGDDASALTHRIRMNAVTPPDEGTAAADPVGLAGRAMRSLGRLRPRPLVSGRTMLAVGLAVALLAGAGYGWTQRPARGDGVVRAPAETLGDRGPAKAAGAGPGAGILAPDAAGTPATSSAPARADVATDPVAPRTQPEALLHTLALRRVALLVRRDAGALGSVHRSGSPSWRADAALLAELERGDQRYAGLGVAAVRATAVSLTGDRAVVRARVDLTAYDVVDASGARTLRPATRGEELEFSLVRTGQGWRVEAISDPADT